jgi:hypothetical protein
MIPVSQVIKKRPGNSIDVILTMKGECKFKNLGMEAVLPRVEILLNNRLVSKGDEKAMDCTLGETQLSCKLTDTDSRRAGSDHKYKIASTLDSLYALGHNGVPRGINQSSVLGKANLDHASTERH